MLGFKFSAQTHPQRFAKLARFLPVLPVFGGGHAKFQPVYVGDLADAVEAMCRGDHEIELAISGKIMEAGGPRGECQ